MRFEHGTSRIREHAVEQLVRHCDTSLKVAGSIPDGVILWPWGRLNL